MRNISSISLKGLNMDELKGVISLYPWYAGGRMELCRRIYAMGGEAQDSLEEAALYAASRRKVADIANGQRSGCTDRDLSAILKSYLEEKKASPKTIVPQPQPRRVAGGDFFSQDEYSKVKTAEDNVFSKFAVTAVAEARESGGGFDPEDFCTETLAEIYYEQGYFNEARKIYSHLLLKFPEKSAYFAALIQNLEKEDLRQ